MPGVPSGRACDQCRKQKKKCDEARPSCSRCVRLGLSCIGSGQQRFTFKDETKRAHSGSRTRKSSSNTPPTPDDQPLISRTPSNELTVLTSALIDRVKLSSDTDLRFSLTWAYGGYLSAIPQRLGTNKALDAAAHALMSSHARFITRQPTVTADALSKYSHALIVLRECLDDPVVACSASTLCAVYLLMLCQTFIACNANPWNSHCEGAARILKARGTKYTGDDSFESALLLSLRGPVLFEAVLNQRIQFTRAEWEDLVISELDKLSDAGPMMGALARVPPILEQGRQALRDGDVEEIAKLHDETNGLYDALVESASPLRTHYQAAAAKASYLDENDRSHPIFPTPLDYRLYAHYQRSLAITLFAIMILSCILRSFPSEGSNIALALQADAFAEEIMSVAHDAEALRPIASGYMPLCLIAAWIGVGEEMREQIEDVMVIYYADFDLDFPRTDKSRRELEEMARRFNLQCQGVAWAGETWK